MKIDQTNFTRDRQSYQLERILTVNEPASVLRVTVKVDAYAVQSFARVERFDGERWREVLTKPGSDFHEQVPSYVWIDGGECKRAAAKVAEPLIELASAIITAASDS